ncbi:MAG: transcriptional regulator [bacterium]|nr:transcriptional regulator [bacterium]
MVADGSPGRTQTLRQALLALLRQGPRTTFDLSRLARLREKDVATHLEHVARSLRHADERLVVTPAVCRGCGFVFRDRRRLTRPSGCPRCRAETVEAPRFHVEPVRRRSTATSGGGGLG